MSKFFVICLAVVLCFGAWITDVTANQCEKKIIYVSSANHDRDEESEFSGLSRLKAMEQIIKNSFPDVEVVRAQHKVSAHNKLFIDGPGYADETTLSRERMKAMGKKFTRGEKLTLNDVCVDQYDVITWAYGKRCREKEVVSEKNVYNYTRNITNITNTTIVQAPPPPPIPAPVVYDRPIPVYPRVVVVYDDYPGYYGYRQARGWGYNNPRYYNYPRSYYNYHSRRSYRY